MVRNLQIQCQNDSYFNIGVIMNLAPEILKMRDALLERIKGKSLKEVAEIVNEILLNETNNINRLAALSARVQVLRDFTKREFNIKCNT